MAVGHMGIFREDDIAVSGGNPDKLPRSLVKADILLTLKRSGWRQGIYRRPADYVLTGQNVLNIQILPVGFKL